MRSNAIYAASLMSLLCGSQSAQISRYQSPRLRHAFAAQPVTEKSSNVWPFTGVTGFALESLRSAHTKRMNRRIRNAYAGERGGYRVCDRRTDSQKRQDAEGLHGYGVNPNVPAPRD